MLSQLLGFVLLNGFNLSMLESFADKHLEDRLDFKLKVKEIRVFVFNLNRLVVSIGVGHENRRGLKPLKI